MPLWSREFDRRTLLSVAAAGAATVAFASPAYASPLGPPRSLRAAAATSSTMSELEARALALTPPVFLLETTVPSQFSTTPGSTMSITGEVAHTGTACLQWDYASQAQLSIDAPLAYMPPSGGNGADVGADVSTISFWVYQFAASSEKLRIELGRGSGTDLWCEVNLDFTGWRTVWIRYQDMQGTANADMNSVRFIAPATAGTLYLDFVLINEPIRSNHPTPDRQVPFVNPQVGTDPNEHWLDLLWFSQQDAQPLATSTPTPGQLADLATVTKAFTANVGGHPKVTATSVASIASAVDALGVPAAGSKPGKGRSIMGYQNAIWPAAIADDLKALDPVAALRDYTTQMQTIANAYTSTTDPSLQGKLADLYVRMLEHFWDQGWDDGSAQGTIHHLGYQARGFYISVWLMRDLLAQRQLLAHAKATLSWLVGMGRVRQSTDDVSRFYNGIMDIVNTTVIGMLGSALLADSDAEKVARVQLVKQWIDNATKFSAGTQGGFKPDLSTFHHMGHYPAYSRDGFSGGSPALMVLSGTSFAVSQETHQRWVDALLAMRFYSNQTQWPIALSNRHPTGDDGLNVNAYLTMTLAGSADGSAALDPVMGAAFLRLLPAKPSTAQSTLAKQLAAAGVVAEPAPTGCQVMNHSPLVSQRRDNWLVSVRGHNRYLWCTEIYPGSNNFGRYMTYGHVQVMAGGAPVTNEGSGFVQPGWDWNRYPGTTTIHLPYEKLNASTDATGEEVLLSDQRLGGGGSIGGQNGAFMMSLHENATHDGSFYARKSVFLFDNRVVVLGEGIVNDDRTNNTETTLFQCHLADTSVPTVDSRNGSIAALPYADASKTKDAVWLVDPQGHGYYVPKGQQLVVSRAVQTAPDQGNASQASEPYATAVLDHGTRPRGGEYEYALVVGATPDSMTTFATAMGKSSTAPYTVVRKDSSAHVVTDRATGITACAVFEGTRKLTKGLVRAVDTPSVVLVQPNASGLALSVTDPDLRFYDGEDTFAPDISPFGVPWKASPSQGSTITVELDGAWTCDAPGVTVTATDGDGQGQGQQDGQEGQQGQQGGQGQQGQHGHQDRATRITVHCADGLPTEIQLKKA